MEVVVVPTVSVALSQLNDAVSTRLTQAQNAGDALLMHSGAQLRLLIDAAQTAFQDSSGQAIDHSSAQVQARLAQIQQLVDHFKSAADDSATQIAQQAQSIVNSLPLSNKRPQLTASSTVVELSPQPSYWPQAVTFQGNWLDQGRLIVCTLQGDERSLTPTSSSTGRLRFQLSPSDLAQLFDVTATRSGQVQSAEARLVVKYSSGGLSSWIYAAPSVEWRVQLVGVHSDGVGRIEVLRTMRHQRRVEQPFRSPNYHVASTREAANNDQIDKHHQYTAPAGWTIAPGSAHIPPPTHHGECTLPQIVSQDAHQVTAKCTTIHRSWGSSGSIDYVVCGQLTQEVQEEREEREQLQLQWGERRVLQRPGTLRWKVVYHQPDGRQVEFTQGTPDDNRFISVTGDEAAITVAAKQPRALDQL